MALRPLRSPSKGATMLFQRLNSTTIVLCCTVALLVGIVWVAAAVY
jgi:hypothetical protein